MPQLPNTLLLTNTYGWLGILTGISLQIMCLSSHQLAYIILFPVSNTVSVVSILL